MGEFWSEIIKAIDGGAVICAHVGAQSQLQRMYPKAAWRFLYMDSALDLREALTTDGCTAFIMETRAMRTDAAITHCAASSNTCGLPPSSPSSTWRYRPRRSWRICCRTG